MLGLGMAAIAGGFILDKLANIGLKSIRGFIDDHCRDKVTPVAGSVVYCDLLLGAEHSGIYVADGEISNIVVTGFANSQVQMSNAREFCSKSTQGTRIYVSCDQYGAVGDDDVAYEAESHVGESSFYGLVFRNCHEFSSKCLSHSSRNPSLWERAKNRFFSLADTEWEGSIRKLKRDARNKLGATKWRLWDLNAQDKTPEPDWDAQNDFFKQQALTPEFIDALRRELDDTQDYIDEIADENIPADIRKKLIGFADTLQAVSDKYDEMKAFLASCPDAQFSYEDLQKCQDVNFTELAQQLKNNQAIQDLAQKMGRNYISEERKKQSKIPTASKSEVHGVQHSDDLMRLLPNELVNLDDETLETLFYARLLEKNLLTYQLSGVTWQNHEENENIRKRTGPVVACLDTSASMSGTPLLKAKALLFAIANILKAEQRSLHVLLFGASGQLKEYTLHGADQLAGLLQFLQQGFNGGTDFETPLQRACDIIQTENDYQKADILMISDGDCHLSDGFITTLQQKKQQLDCMVYSVLCHGQRVSDRFSDEVIVL